MAVNGDFSKLRVGIVAAALCLASAPLLAGLPAAGEATVVAQGQDRLLKFDAGTAAGQGAIVLQDADGKAVRELGLQDFLPAAYVQALPQGEHGLQWWREARRVEGREVVEFSVPAPGTAAGPAGPALHFSIDLGDGRVRTAEIREYLAAADQARALATASASN